MTQPPFRTLQLSEKLQDTENEAMSKIVELEKQLMQRNKELDVVRVSVKVTRPMGPREGTPALAWPSVPVRGVPWASCLWGLFPRRSSEGTGTVVGCTRACAITRSGHYVLVTGFRSNSIFPSGWSRS